MISTVFFDGDQTLWDFDAVMRAALAATTQELLRLWPAAASSDISVDALIADRRAIDATEGLSTHEDLRRAAFLRTLRRVGSRDEELADHLTGYYLTRRFDGVAPYPDVAPALRALHGRYRLGLLSNGNSYPQRCGLDGVFDVITFAQEHGVTKPDRRLFDLAATKAGVPPTEIVMIGDSLRNDVLGAQLAGWRAIWLNRTNASPRSGIRPDATVSSLLEVPEVLLDLDLDLPT